MSHAVKIGVNGWTISLGIGPIVAGEVLEQATSETSRPGLVADLSRQRSGLAEYLGAPADPDGDDADRVRVPPAGSGEVACATGNRVGLRALGAAGRNGPGPLDSREQLIAVRRDDGSRARIGERALTCGAGDRQVLAASVRSQVGQVTAKVGGLRPRAEVVRPGARTRAF
jgi:hypothetical protein